MEKKKAQEKNEFKNEKEEHNPTYKHIKFLCCTFESNVTLSVKKPCGGSNKAPAEQGAQRGTPSQNLGILTGAGGRYLTN